MSGLVRWRAGVSNKLSILQGLRARWSLVASKRAVWLQRTGQVLQLRVYGYAGHREALDHEWRRSAPVEQSFGVARPAMRAQIVFGGKTRSSVVTAVVRHRVNTFDGNVVFDPEVPTRISLGEANRQSRQI